MAIVIPNDSYTEGILEVSKQASDSYDRICYVSLNKLFKSLIKSLQYKDVNVEKFYFVDAITKSALPDIKDEANSTFIPSASSLRELGIAINGALNRKVYDCMIFDSLSTLQIYNREDIVVEFVHSLIGRIRLSDCVSIFSCLEGDTKTGMIKNMGMFVDRMVHLEAHTIIEYDTTIVEFEARGAVI